MFVVDTNILLYAADRDSPAHVKCREQVDAWRKQPSIWYLTWGIVYEFLRVATHPNVFRKPFSAKNAYLFIQAVLASPSVSMLVETERHQETLAEMLADLPGITGNLLFDAHTAILMREHGIRTIYTRDTDFHRFTFLEVINPIV